MHRQQHYYIHKKEFQIANHFPPFVEICVGMTANPPDKRHKTVQEKLDNAEHCASNMSSSIDSSRDSKSDSASIITNVGAPTNTRVIQLLKRPRMVVNHSYVDYSLVPFDPNDNVIPSSSDKTDIDKLSFHQKLHVILELSNSQHIACWLPHGRAFSILNPAKFESTICPEYFGHSRYSSFLHQLGIQGYKRITKAQNKHVYYSQVSRALYYLAIWDLFKGPIT